MQFLMIWTPGQQKHPTPEDMVKMEKLVADGKNAGTLLHTGGLAAGSQTMKVVRKGDKITVMDGPFPETKEMMLGFAIVEATSREHAIEQAKTFVRCAGDGESLCFPILNGPPPPER